MPATDPSSSDDTAHTAEEFRIPAQVTEAAMKQIRHILLASACAFAVTACGSLGGPKVAIKVYSPPTQVQVDPAWPMADWTLAVGTSSAVEALDSPRIAVRPTPNELQTYKGAAWADTAPDMLRAAVVEGFEDSGKIASVARFGGASGSDRSDLGLQLEIRAFETDYGSGAPEAVIEVQARLVDRRGDAFATKRFRRAVAGASAEIPAMVDAFGETMSQLTTDVVGWTLVEGNRLRAEVPARRND
jgi:cholesterol transport system auxiliary component